MEVNDENGTNLSRNNLTNEGSGTFIKEVKKTEIAASLQQFAEKTARFCDNVPGHFNFFHSFWQIPTLKFPFCR